MENVNFIFSSNEPPFVGESRLQIVESMVKAFDEVGTNGTPQWISIEAPSGWGKTRIAQEFYSRLARERQRDQHGYWPPSMFDNQDINASDINLRRKIIYPHVVHLPGTLPSFAWWGITCSRRGGVSTRALAADIGQFEAHAPFLEDAWGQLRSKKERIRSGVNELGTAVGDEIVSEVFGTALDAIGVSVPGLGLVKWVASVGLDQVRDRSARRERLHSNEAITPSSRDLVEETLEKLVKLSRPGLPLVIFIEDFHCAETDSALTELLSQLLEARAAVLLITSALPGHFTDGPTLGRLLEKHAGILKRIRPQEEVDSVSPSMPSDIRQLSQRDLRSIVRHYHPAVDFDTECNLVRRYTNPLMLELVCARPLYRNKFPQGDLCLSVEEIKQLPSNLYGLYLQQWDDLPQNLRYALSLAAHCTPQLISNTYGCPPMWHLKMALALLVEMHSNSPHLDLDGITLALRESAVAYSWVLEVRPMLLEFTDPDQRTIAYSEEILDTSSALESVLADLISKQIRKGFSSSELFASPDEEEYAAWATLALHRAGRGADPGALAAASILLLDSLESYPRELTGRVDIARYALCHIEPSSPSGREIRQHLALALYEQGQISEAIGVLERLIGEWEDACGPNDAGVVGAKVRLTNLFRTAGRLDDAMHLGESVLEVYRDIPQFVDEVFATLFGLAQSLGLAGRTVEAINLCETLLSVEPLHGNKSVFWPIRADLAYFTGASGGVGAAIRMTESLLGDQMAQLDSDDPSVLISRYNLYYWKSKVSLDGETLSLFAALLDESRRIFGSHHPQTARVHNALIACKGELGHLEDAIVELEQLLQTQKEYLSADHPDMLVTRNNIAVFRLKNGDHARATVLLESLLKDQERILGAEDALTSATRNELLWIYDRSGMPSEIVRLYKTLFLEQVKRLGLGHPEVDETRYALSMYLEETGQIKEAIALYESYYAHQENLYGAEHEDVCYARDKIKELRGG